MKKALIIIDMQNDFVTGSLGTKEAEEIVGAVEAKVKAAREDKTEILFTRDTHGEDYLVTKEGRSLPVVHCVKGTDGWEIIDCLKPYADTVFDKETFGSTALSDYVASQNYDAVELAGLCTDICVVSNALLLKARMPEMDISVDPKCCAGVTPESHKAALLTMQMCQIQILS